MTAGAPTKYDPGKLPVILDLFKEGASISEVCLELDISRQTFYDWKDVHPEFVDTVKRGVQLSRGWWEKQGRLGVKIDHGINPTMWFMNMKNRFGKEDPDDVTLWKDKHEHEHSGDAKNPIHLIERVIVRPSDKDS